jgi:glucan 1,3-beta-glucosidase
MFSRIAGRYVPRDPAYAEGSCGVPLEVLFDFYARAYAAISKHMGADKAAVFHDGFRLKAWKDFMRGPEYQNVVLDTHLYPGMMPMAENEGPSKLYAGVLSKIVADIREMAPFFPVIVGEWSLCHPRALTQDQSLDSISRLMRMLADAQLYAWAAGSGWYFWSYKVPSGAPGWDARSCVESRWLII